MKKHNEIGEPIAYEEQEVIERGFGSRKNPFHLRHSALQERSNEMHSMFQTDLNKKHSNEHNKLVRDVLGRSEIGEIKILGNKINSTGKILKKF
jgi:hypothetical protein